MRTIIVLLSIVGSTAMAGDPVVELEFGERAPFAGRLFTVEHSDAIANKLRVFRYELEQETRFNKAINEEKDKNFERSWSTEKRHSDAREDFLITQIENRPHSVMDIMIGYVIGAATILAAWAAIQ